MKQVQGHVPLVSTHCFALNKVAWNWINQNQKKKNMKKVSSSTENKSWMTRDQVQSLVAHFTTTEPAFRCQDGDVALPWHLRWNKAEILYAWLTGCWGFALCKSFPDWLDDSQRGYIEKVRQGGSTRPRHWRKTDSCCRLIKTLLIWVEQKLQCWSCNELKIKYMIISGLAIISGLYCTVILHNDPKYWMWNATKSNDSISS